MALAPEYGMQNRRSATMSAPSGRHAIHLLTQAERTHVGPDLLDELEAFLLQPALAGGAPASGDRLVLRPDGVLLFVVHHHLENHVVSIEHGVALLSLNPAWGGCLQRFHREERM